MNPKTPVLYVKTGCPWCAEAAEYLAKHAIKVEVRNVTGDRSAFAEMERLSGQTKAPVLDWRGQVLADFGLDELKPFLKKVGAGR